MTQHALYSPSQLERILACPGSVSLTKDMLEPKESEYAAEGTFLHSIMEQCLTDKTYNPELDGRLTPEQKQAITDNLNYLSELNLQGKQHVEKYLNMPGIPDCGGTADLIIITENEIHVIDWKFGSGILVNTKDNPQLTAYAIMATHWYENQPKPCPRRKECGKFKDKICDNVCNTSYKNEYRTFIHVCQPYINNFQSMEITKDDMAAFYNELLTSIRNAESDHPTFNPGEAQCRWCLAAGQCKHQLQFVDTQAVDIFKHLSPVNENEQNLSIALKIFNNRKAIENGLKAVEKFIYTELINGKDIPGLKLVQGRANRIWKEGVTKKDIAKLVNVSEIFLVEPEKLLSPAKLEKIITKEEREFIKDLFEKKESSLTIVNEDDKRESIKMNPANRAIQIFKNIEVK
jgi:hypothetical protein